MRYKLGISSLNRELSIVIFDWRRLTYDIYIYTYDYKITFEANPHRSVLPLQVTTPQLKQRDRHVLPGLTAVLIHLQREQDVLWMTSIREPSAKHRAFRAMPYASIACSHSPSSLQPLQDISESWFGELLCTPHAIPSFCGEKWKHKKNKSQACKPRQDYSEPPRTYLCNSAPIEHGKVMKSQEKPTYRTHYEHRLTFCQKNKKGWPTVDPICEGQGTLDEAAPLFCTSLWPWCCHWPALLAGHPLVSACFSNRQLGIARAGFYVLWCSMMFYDVLWCSMMFYDVLWCSMMFYDVLWLCDCLRVANTKLEECWGIGVASLRWQLTHSMLRWKANNLRKFKDQDRVPDKGE